MNRLKILLPLLLILILCMILSAISQLLPSAYLIPLALGSILGTMLIGYRSGICLMLALSLLILWLAKRFKWWIPKNELK